MVGQSALPSFEAGGARRIFSPWCHHGHGQPQQESLQVPTNSVLPKKRILPRRASTFLVNSSCASYRGRLKLADRIQHERLPVAADDWHPATLLRPSKMRSLHHPKDLARLRDIEVERQPRSLRCSAKGPAMML